MKKVTIETIEHSRQRYDTAGDYQSSPLRDRWLISVSETGNWRYNMLVALHEFVELLLVRDKGITNEAIDDFDLHPPKNCAADLGFDPRAPYHRQHRLADVVERLVATEMGVDWAHYEKTLDKLKYQP